MNNALSRVKKPSNELKLDNGAARDRDGLRISYIETSTELTSTSLSGTTHFIAPEVLCKVIFLTGGYEGVRHLSCL